MTHDDSRALSLRAEVDVLYAFDIGAWVDLEVARDRVGVLDAPVLQQAGEPPVRAPLVWREAAEPVVEAGTKTRPGVQITVHAFAAISLRYTIDHEGSLESLRALSCRLDDAPALLAAARAQAQSVLARLGDAVSQPKLARRSEDYLLFLLPGQARRLGEMTAGQPGLLASILRGVEEDPPAEEASDAVAVVLAPTVGDRVLVDWRACLAATETPGDLRAVLELANVQHLELVLLDRYLDGFLEAVYEGISSSRWWPLRLLVGARRADLRRLARMEVDAAILFERVTNAGKFLIDRPAVRLYQLAAKRFELSQWALAIQRKLEALQRLYARLYERTSTIRLEFLEWVIIVLIALSILITLF